jgi:hypothetical protein
MAQLVRQRQQLFSQGDWSVAREILHPDVCHLDMVQVYRSNWQGAKGHQQRKEAQEGRHAGRQAGR